MIQQSGHFDYDKNLEDFYDYHGYGQRRILEEGGQFNECGYVVYRGAVPLEELLQGVPAEQSTQEQSVSLPAEPEISPAMM